MGIKLNFLVTSCLRPISEIIVRNMNINAECGLKYKFSKNGVQSVMKLYEHIKRMGR